MPETVPYPIGMLAIPAVLLVLIAFATGILYGLVACGFVYGAAYLLMHSKQATLHRQPATFRVSPTLVVAGNTTVAGMNWAISKLGPISYRVDVEARGVPTTLAGGLTEPVAAAILADVSQVLQLQP